VADVEAIAKTLGRATARPDSHQLIVLW
jgi:hypothetical protein